MGFRLSRPPAKQQGPGSQRQPKTSLAYADERARAEKGKRCFAEQRRIGAVVCSPRRVYLSRMQVSEPPFEPWVRWVLCVELPNWLRWFEASCTQKACSCKLLLLHEGETFGVCFNLGDHQQSSRAQGVRGSPDPLWPMETRGLGEKKPSVALLSKGALWLWSVSLGESTFPECRSQNLVLSRG